MIAKHIGTSINSCGYKLAGAPFFGVVETAEIAEMVEIVGNGRKW